MLNKTIALVGLSGVGKSTLIKQVSDNVQFQTLSASKLIKDQKDAYTKHDELRLHDINNNQRLLIEGFKQALDRKEKITLLDAHTIIETKKGVTEIPTEVFKEIGVDHFIMLVEKPESIFQLLNLYC